MPTETSIESHIKLEATGEMGRCKQIVYDFIKNNPGCSLKDIHEGTELSQENVCGRKKSLEEEGMIIKSGEKQNKETNRTVETWKVSEEKKDQVLDPEQDQRLSINEMHKAASMVRRANKYQKEKIKGWCDEKWEF